MLLKDGLFSTTGFAPAITVFQCFEHLILEQILNSNDLDLSVNKW
jgi:hypothetical protein